MIKAYLEKYPCGEFRSVAEIMLSKLQQTEADLKVDDNPPIT